MQWMLVAAHVTCAGLLAAGCGGGGSGSGEPEEGADGEELEVFPARLYSGFDGTNTYRVPAVVENASGRVSWSISDPSLATLSVSGTNGDLVTITTKKAGDARITATVGGTSRSVPLTVYAYSQAEYAAGKLRYESNRDGDNPACSSCHGGGGPNHSPSEIGRDPDEDIVTMIVTGVDPENNPEEPARIADRTEFSSILRGKTHEWKITEAEKKGLVAYIRALPPLGRPALDND